MIPIQVCSASVSTDEARYLGLRRWALRLIVPAVVLTVWQIWTTLWPNYATPPLQDIAAALIRLVLGVDFWAAIADTFISLFYGFTISVLVGVPAAIVVGRMRLLEALADGYLTIILTVPSAALVPVFIVLFGVGMSVRVAVIVLFALPILVRNAITGISSVPRNLLQMARAFNCGRMAMARRIIFPSALPEIFAGLRLAASRAVIGMIVAEMIVISAGVGRLLTLSTASFELPRAYALTIVVFLISAAFVSFVQAIETRALGWRSQRSGLASV
jgi:ABC-type nitrate/sulfonate/bicarbonate transport system permease component